MASLRDDVTLAAYLAPLEPPPPPPASSSSSSSSNSKTAAATNSNNGSGEQRQVVLLQRRITVDDRGDGNGGDGFDRQGGRLRVEVVGVPRLIWFRAGWSCARVRVLLLQVSQLVSHDNPNTFTTLSTSIIYPPFPHSIHSFYHYNLCTRSINSLIFSIHSLILSTLPPSLSTQNILAAQVIDPQAVRDKLKRLQQDEDVDVATAGGVVVSDEEKVALTKQLVLLEEAVALTTGASASSSSSSSASKVKGQMALSGHLPVRLVTNEGDSAFSSVTGAVASSGVHDARHGGLLLSASEGLPDHGNDNDPDGHGNGDVLGSGLPNDNTVPFMRWASR